MAAYIKFDGIDGEVIEKDHDKWTELRDFSLNFHKSGGGSTGATRNAGSTIFEPMSISKFVDASTSKLLELVAGNKKVKVKVHLTTSTDKGDQVYLAYELTNVMVTGLSTNGDGSVRAYERLTLDYTEIKVEYFPIADDGVRGGAMVFAWNVNTNKPA